MKSAYDIIKKPVITERSMVSLKTSTFSKYRATQTR